MVWWPRTAWSPASATSTKASLPDDGPSPVGRAVVVSGASASLPPVTAMGLVALGYLLALVDVRISGVDVVPDVLGWALVVLGLTRLNGRGRFDRARQAAVITGVLSLADLLHPVITTTTGSAGTGTASVTAAVDPGGLQGLVLLGYVLAETVTSVLLSLALRDLAHGHGDRRTETTFARFARLHVLLGAASVSFAAISYRTGPREVTGPGAVLFGLAVLLVLAFAAWFVVAIYRCRGLPWLGPAVARDQPVEPGLPSS